MTSDEFAPLSPQHCLSPGQGGYMQSKYVSHGPLACLSRCLRCISFPASTFSPFSPAPLPVQFIYAPIFVFTDRFIAERLVRAASVLGHSLSFGT
jgi:hypothetical protein